jgi:hypothetical protein
MNDKKDSFESLVRKLLTRLSPEHRAKFKQHAAEPLAVFYSGNLRRLAQIYGSNKWGGHWYCQHYERHFAPLRKKDITLLEVGIGNGSSLRMWRKYFSRGRIYGLDILDKSAHNEKRIRTFQGDQSDETFLRLVIKEIATPDIIIDDGSHLNKHVLKTFEVLFPLLADRGIYVIEDTLTSYWPSFGGGSQDLTNAPTSMCMLKGLADGLNHAEYMHLRPGFVPSYTDKHIVSLHFFHNMVIIYKGENNEEGFFEDLRHR